MMRRWARPRIALRFSHGVGAAVTLAAWLGSSTPVCAQSAPNDAATERERQAKDRYDEGVSAYHAGHFQQAITLFLVADQLAPRAAMAFNIARAYERLDDSAGALRFYRDYLRRETSPVNATGVRARIEQLEGRLAAQGVQQLTVLSEPTGAFVSVDGQPRGPTPWTGELVPGSHQLTLLKEGYAVARREVILEAAHAADLSVPLEASGATPEPPPAALAPPADPVATRAPEPKSDPRPAEHALGPWPWITLGAGGAALLAAGGFELARASAEEDAHSATTQIEYVDAFHAAEARQTAARVLAGVGGALVVAGGVLLVLDFMPKGDAKKVAATAACTSDGCWGSFEGSF